MSGCATSTVDRQALAARLREGARANAYALGACDEFDQQYRRDDVFAGDEELGRAYDRGFADCESQSLSDFLANSEYATGRFVGVFCRGATHDGTPEGTQAALEFVQSEASA